MPLKTMAILLPMEMATIFSNIQYILCVNEELVRNLQNINLLPPFQQLIGVEFLRLVRILIIKF